jgi:predicted TIM-barrel fold metal-dependent hydrolase
MTALTSIHRAPIGSGQALVIGSIIDRGAWTGHSASLALQTASPWPTAKDPRSSRVEHNWLEPKSPRPRLLITCELRVLQPHDLLHLRFLRILLMLAYLCAAGGCTCPFKEAERSETFSFVDAHTHIFNARDLPLAGILASRGISDGAAAVFAGVLELWTPEDSLPVPEIRRVDGMSDLSEVTAQIRAAFNAREQRNLTSPLLNDAQKTVLQKELEELGAPRLKNLTRGRASEDEQAVAIASQILSMANVPPSCEAISPLSPLPRSAGFLQSLRFLSIITSSHPQIGRRLSNRHYPKVSLFVHHMMDMQVTYASETVLPFDQQMEVVSEVDRLFKGRLIHFVAFDPFRRTDSLNYVKRGLQLGAVGVKFYPPSGYRAASNEIPLRPQGDAGHIRRWESRYGGDAPLTGKELDRLCDSLFEFCEANDLPIFAHCTPGGFEAVPGYGMMSDPTYWASVLRRHPRLRLCFGHSGGGDYWFAPSEPSTNASASAEFGKKVVELCLRYPNVYCDVGYLDRVLEPTSRANLRRRLASLMSRKSSDDAWSFGDKMVYGSDWHMISREKDADRYLQRFVEVFEEPKLRAWRRAFFARNMMDFVRLAYICNSDDPRFTKEQKDYWRGLLSKSGPMRP